VEVVVTALMAVGTHRKASNRARLACGQGLLLDSYYPATACFWCPCMSSALHT